MVQKSYTTSRDTIPEEAKGQRRIVLFSRETTQLVHPPLIDGRQGSRIEEYLRKSILLKQVMSNKARKYRAINATQNFATVAISSLLLFIGFSGLEKVQKYISWVRPITHDGAELAFNLLVFAIFVVGVLHLVFRFSEKQSSAEKGIAALATLANEIEDTVTSKGNLVISEEASRVDLVRTRYEAIAENLPANSDREFLQAKRDVASKEARRPTITISPQQLFDEDQQRRIVASIVLGSRAVVDALIALRSTDKSLFLGGGMIRNVVWDYLHGYGSPTQTDDVDVIHYNPADSEKRHDEAIQMRLATLVPNAKWSVKNQARMHISNSETAYTSLEHAISRWPETATAFIARLDDSGWIEFVAPYGFDDLLRLLIVNTPAFEDRIETIRARVEAKQWQRFWPRLKIILPD
ncbi:nucleotidyltransferase family protein [Novosphingobium sp. YAF33]|uniref:nucleotidyltransferase family protein n=1 Tax=Novosphingobium sp. YAF33 TaxID=3233082 RepID=UPI003F9DEF99